MWYARLFAPGVEIHVSARAIDTDDAGNLVFSALDLILERTIPGVAVHVAPPVALGHPENVLAAVRDCPATALEFDEGCRRVTGDVTRRPGFQIERGQLHHFVATRRGHYVQLVRVLSPPCVARTPQCADRLTFDFRRRAIRHIQHVHVVAHYGAVARCCVEIAMVHRLIATGRVQWIDAHSAKIVAVNEQLLRVG